MFEKHRKNEDVIKDLIVRGHKNGTCDRDGKSVRKIIDGHRVFSAKPRILSSQTYICRDGKMVLKNGE